MACIRQRGSLATGPVSGVSTHAAGNCVPIARGLSGLPEPPGPEGDAHRGAPKVRGRGDTIMLKVGAGTAGFARGLLLAGSAAAALCVPGVAFAQDEADPAAEAADTDGDAFSAEEDTSTGNQIVVTATKREKTLQDTPVAVSVTGAET